jgi:hypothetical protein
VSRRISLADHKKCSDIATIASYGLEWARADEIPPPSKPRQDYEIGGIETVARQISCCLYQWFRPRIELDTADTRDRLRLYEFPSKEKIEEALVKLVEAQ